MRSILAGRSRPVISRRWPQIRTDDLAWVYFDPQSGFLRARAGCEAVRDAVVAEGGRFVQQQVILPERPDGELSHVLTSGGTKLKADRFLFAGGPWLLRLFPELTRNMKVTRQIEFFFATPTEASYFMENRLPCWTDRDENGKSRGYGVPGNDYRGFKIAYELRDDITDRFDRYDRFYRAEEVEHTRQVLANRFPKLRAAPFIEGRVCQYTETPDLDFILGLHPAHGNVWILGGGSGHGYKHGASLGELTAQVMAGTATIPAPFALQRLV